MKFGASALYLLLAMTFVFALKASIQAWHLATGGGRLLSSEPGNFAGLLVAALVVFFMAPLQRFAEGARVTVARVTMTDQAACAARARHTG